MGFFGAAAFKRFFVCWDFPGVSHPSRWLGMMLDGIPEALMLLGKEAEKTKQKTVQTKKGRMVYTWNP